MRKYKFLPSLFYIHLITGLIVLAPCFAKTTVPLYSIKERQINVLQTQSEKIKTSSITKDREHFWELVSEFANCLQQSGNFEKAFSFQALYLNHLISQNKLNNTQNQQITTVAFYCLIPIMVFFLFLVFIVYRSRRELLFKQRENQIKQQVSEMEMKALRSQMNPHFIFNCMNSIYNYMHEENIKLASEYLVNFSKLIRKVLENSIYSEVTLEEDFVALELYIQMEQMRLQHKFNYKIDIQNVSASTILIPPLILQPFVENAIWHGLNNKNEGGLLQIIVSQEKSMVKCCIEDNGEVQSLEDTKKDLTNLIEKTSLGINLTRERIELLNRLKGVKAYFHETLLSDEKKNHKGRRVEIFLPFEVE